MIHRALHNLDAFLMGRIFQPIAHWADYRWHVNHFRLANIVLKIGIVAGIAGSFANWLPYRTWVGAICVAINLFNVWVVKDMMRRMDEASAAYERDPAYLPTVAYVYAVMMAPVRVTTFIMSMSLFAMILGPAIMLGNYGLPIQLMYLLGYAAALYFAGVIPSGRARKPKTERAPAGLLPAPAP